MTNSAYAVIMAGGHGTRFWPRSRKKRPKQLLDIVGSEPMIQQTVARIEPLFPLQNILVVTNKDHAPLIKERLPGINPENILAEPCGRNTAPALALASVWLMAKEPDTTMVVLTADHLIQKESVFLEHLKQGINLASEDEYMVTLGIQPAFPETGYGYIQMGDPHDGSNTCFRVERYVEKPDRETAELYIKNGRYLWNSGMFIWKTGTFWRALQRFLPSIHHSFERLRKAWCGPAFPEMLNSVYQEVKPISVDYGIMEKSDRVLVIRADIGWDDVGSWTALDRIIKKGEDGNIINGPHISIDTKNTIAYSTGKLIATIGIHDLIIVETEDAILVCHKDKAQDIKTLVDRLEEKGLDKYL